MKIARLIAGLFAVFLFFGGTGSALAQTIDVMIVYDTKAKTWVDSNGGMSAFSQDVVNKLNLALVNSDISDLNFNLVHAVALPYTTVDLSTDLQALTYGTGNLATVPTLRNTYGADVVTMLVDTGSAYGTVGLGWLLNNMSGLPNYAFTVCSIRSVDLSHTLTHEIGHNLGAHHSKDQASSPGPNTSLNTYSAGWYFTGSNGTDYHTIMAYGDDGYGNYYYEAPLFSTPLLSYQNTVAGDAADGDNARTLRETMNVVASYRSSMPDALPPTSITVPSTDNDGTFTVSWGASGTSSVTYVLEEASNSGFTSNLRTAYSGTSLNTVISGKAESSYYYRVKATRSGYIDSAWRTGGNGCVVTFPLPAGTPTSISVPSSDADGNYAVSWGASSTAGATYILEEATNSGFTSDLRTAYSGTELTAWVTDKAEGTYYYRVKATRDGYDDSSYQTAGNPCVVFVPMIVSPASITSADPTLVDLALQLPSGETALIEQFIDANQDGVVDAGDGRIRSFSVTDGVASTSPNVQGDEDGVADGVLTTTLNYLDELDLYHAPAAYLFRATVAGDEVIVPFEVNASPQAQTVSGSVSDSNGPVAGVLVALEAPGYTAGYAVTNATGSFLLDVREPGTYQVTPISFLAGHYTDDSLQPQVTVASGSAVSGVALILGLGSYAVSGQVSDDQTGTGIGSVWIDADGTNGSIFATALADPDGNYTLSVPVGDYLLVNNVNSDFGLSPSSQGYVGYAERSVAVTVSADVTGADFTVTPATVWISGQVVDTFGVGQPGLAVVADLAGDADRPMATALTAEDGSFTLGLIAGETWQVALDSQSSLGRSLVATQIANLSTSGTLSGQDLTVYPASASVSGVVSDGQAQPMADVEVYLRNADASIRQTIQTDASGQYTLPAFAGTWWVGVVVGGFDIPEQTVSLIDGQTGTIDFSVVSPPMTAVALSADLASPQAAPASITFTAEGSGASGQYEYQFWLKGPSTNNAWQAVRAYSTTPTWTWSADASAAGTSIVSVYARSLGSTAAVEVLKTLSYTITAVGTAATAVTLTSDLASPQAAPASMTFTAQGSGSSVDAYEYQFWLKGPSTGNVWQVVRTYATTPTWTWSAASDAVGTSTVSVYVRAAGSTSSVQAFKTLTYSIISVGTPASAVTLTSDLASPQAAPASITFTAQGSGSSIDAYEYQFWLKGPSTNNTWQVVRTYSTTPTWTWSADSDAVGTSTVSVYVRAAGSPVSYDTFSYLFYTLALPDEPVFIPPGQLKKQ